jgi:hypothetical protein
VVAVSVALAGCAADAGAPAAGTAPPLAAVLATQLPGVTGAAKSTGARHPAHRARPRSGHPAIVGGLPWLGITPASPSRSRREVDAAPAATALDAAGAARVAAPACATLRDALAGDVPDVVRRRAGNRALAVVTQAVASALLGLPVDVPASARAERKHLAAAYAALGEVLAGSADPSATAATARAGVRAYAAAIGIDGCG